MFNLIRKYNQNRFTIWVVVVGIVLLVMVWRSLNEYFKKNPSIEEEAEVSIYNDKNYSVVTEERVNKYAAIVANDVINEFVEYCNSGKINGAYSLLSEECKSRLYPTVEDFAQNYVSKFYATPRVCEKQAWISDKEKNRYTYRVYLKEDPIYTRYHRAIFSNRRVLYDCSG